MLANERKQKILDFINEKESVSVLELKDSLGVSEMTIRRDLDQLDKEGELIRVRGGAAKLMLPSTQRKAFEERSDKNYREKQRIGKFAASLIRNKDSVFFDSGTTIMELVKYLDRNMELFTMTFSILIAIQLSKYKNNETYIPGGFIRDSKELNIVGNPSLQGIEKFSVNRLFIGAWGFHETRGLVYLDVEESLLREKMIDSAHEVNVLVDSSKFGKDGLVSLNNFSKIDRIITDDKITQNYIEFCISKGIQLYVVSEDDNVKVY